VRTTLHVLGRGLNIFCAANVEQFDQLLGVNVRGTMLCYKHAALQMIAQGRGGRIIGLSPVSLLLLTHLDSRLA